MTGTVPTPAKPLSALWPAVLDVLDKATRSATGRRLFMSACTVAVGAALRALKVPAEVATVLTPDAVQVLSDVLQGVGLAGIFVFNSINHRVPAEK